jgi:hypothetical protein
MKGDRPAFPATLLRIVASCNFLKIISWEGNSGVYIVGNDKYSVSVLQEFLLLYRAFW